MWVSAVTATFVKTLLMNDKAFESNSRTARSSFNKKKLKSKSKSKFKSNYKSKNHYCSTYSGNNLLKFPLSLSTFLSLPSLTASVFVEIFFECVVFCQITVLMNDIRLKSFYSKASNTKNNNSNNSSNSSHKSHSSTLATSVGTSAAVLSLTKFTSSSNNNHLRTYNNSSKSNKVFLYYTPRDPRLRIFLKTKQFSNRPQCKVFDNSLISSIFTIANNNDINNNHNNIEKSAKKRYNLNYNYNNNNQSGELIGGSIGAKRRRRSISTINGELSLNKANSALNDLKINILQQQQINLISVQIVFNTTTTTTNCDNFPSELLIITTTRDNYEHNKCISAVVVSTAVAPTTSAAILATLLLNIVIAHQQHLKELLASYIVGALLSCFFANAVNQSKNSIQRIGVNASI